MPNLDSWINLQSDINKESTTPSQVENHLLSIRDEHQNRIGAKHHPTYNEPHQKNIELIDWTLEKYKASIKETQQNEQVIIDDIIEELDKKRDIAIHKKSKLNLKMKFQYLDYKKLLLIMFFSGFVNWQ
ncbi:MAG: hypothetical protein ACRD6U_08870 [Nitrososphaeraceae archaeon]